MRLYLDCPASMLSGQLSCCLQHLSVSSDDPRSVKFIAMLPDPHHFVPVNKTTTFIAVQLHESEKEMQRHTLRQEGVAQRQTPHKELHKDTPLAKKGLHKDTPVAKKELHRHTPHQGVAQRHAPRPERVKQRHTPCQEGIAQRHTPHRTLNF